MRFIVAMLISVLFLAAGCQEVTPELKAKQDAAFTAQSDAATTLAKVQEAATKHLKEYNEIKAMIDAGQDVPAVLVLKFDKLKALIASDYALFNEAKEKFETAKKTYDEATAAGLTWYNKIDWWTVGKVGGGILLGLAGLYFPVMRPATAAAQAALQSATSASQACIQGVSAVYAADPDIGQKIKDAVLERSRTLKVEPQLDALVQRFDPPAVNGSMTMDQTPRSQLL